MSVPAASAAPAARGRDTDPMPDPRHDPEAAAKLRASNRRVALTLATIAAVFFFGVIASKYIGGYTVGMGVLGLAIFVFLVFVIVRAIRDR